MIFKCEKIYIGWGWTGMGLSFEERRNQLGLNITYYRRAQKLTQMQLADRVNVSSCYISQIERGLKTVSLPTLMKIADVLDIEEMRLLDFGRGKA